MIGVHMAGDNAWVQLALVGRVNYDVVLHLRPTVPIRGATAAVTFWLKQASHGRQSGLEIRGTLIISTHKVGAARRSR